MNSNKRTMLTHSGPFHADDVFAVALIKLVFGDDLEVIRSRDESLLSKADIVVDVGGVYDPKIMRFDHHQSLGAGERENGIPYASFGLVWKSFGNDICGSEKIYKNIDKKLVSYIDAVDNGLSTFNMLFEDVYPYTIIDFFSSFKSHNDSDEDLDRTFIILVEEAKNILKREIEKEKISESLRNKILDIYNKSENRQIIFLPERLPWKEILVSFKEPFFVVYPGEGEEGAYRDWRAQAIPLKEKSFELRKPFPESWAGKRGDELANISGIPDAIFCHKNRFIVSAKTKEGALALAEKALIS